MNTEVDILDATLDDLADLPGFAPFNVGAHRCKMVLETKEINKKPAVECKLTLIETMELANATDTPQRPGDATNILMMLKNNDGSLNEFSQGQLKAILTTLKEAGLPGATNREMIANTKDGIEVIAVTGQRENKGTGQKNTTLIKFTVVG